MMKIPSGVVVTAGRYGLVFLLLLMRGLLVVKSDPLSHPYIPFRTSPFEQSSLHHNLTWTETHAVSKLTKHVVPHKEKKGQQEQQQQQQQCPFQFSLGVSRRSHQDATFKKSSLSITQPPLIYPIHPSRGPGKQVLYTTQYEHLDVLSPATTAQLGLVMTSIVKEGLVQDQDYPLLFESSSFFHTSPLLHDVNSDGIPDAILVDYDGAVYVIGLATWSSKDGTKFFHHAQMPRLFVRRDWFEARLNATLPKKEEKKESQQDADSAGRPSPQDLSASSSRSYDDNPYYSYFEWSTNRKTDLLRGVTANVVQQEQHELEQLENRRSQRVGQKRQVKPQEEEEVTTTNKEDEEKGKGGGDDNNNNDKKDEGNVEKDNNNNKKDEGNNEQGEKKQQVPNDNTDNNNNNKRNKEEQVRQEKEIDNERNNPNLDKVSSPETTTTSEEVNLNNNEQQQHGRRLQEVLQDGGGGGGGDTDTDTNGSDHQEGLQPEEENYAEQGGWADEDDYKGAKFDDDYNTAFESDDDSEDTAADEGGDNNNNNNNNKGFNEEEDAEDAEVEDQPAFTDDGYPKYAYGDDMYYGDDRYAYGHNSFYDEKNFVRIPPHVLSTPVLVEIPKSYSSTGEMEHIMICAVSYYFDEDEYEGHFSYKRFNAEDEGDETEERRGQYIASAILTYTFDGTTGRWSRQQHLDTSGDYTAPQNGSLVPEVTMSMDNTKMGAFALASPTVADVDGDGSLDIIMGTSMGIVYNLDAKGMYNIRGTGWPIQMKRGVESRILVEDVVGDTNLEIFVIDVGGNLVCLDHKGDVIWHRNLAKNLHQTLDVKIVAMSPMTLGDVDGDGSLDLVVVIGAEVPNMFENNFIFAVSASTGKDIKNFPFAIKGKPVDSAQSVQEKIPQPLLVDLHADQSYWKAYMQRNNTSIEEIKRTLQKNNPSSLSSDNAPQGGNARGLHIVQPVGTDIFIIEGGSGCAHTVPIGDEVTAMVQADDVHGTGNVDLVVSTASGNIITLDSPGVPYHPLNVWNNGELRNQGNSFAQGFGASQGIYVMDVSRQYRDIFGIFVPVTFEIFDNRPNIQNEQDKRRYQVEVRDGTSSSRSLFRKVYNATGTYTERFYIHYGPGYYSLKINLKTTHGLIYEDTFHIGYNVHFLDGFGLLLWLPLAIAGIPILLCSRRKSWEDDDFDGIETDGSSNLGILGRELPS